HLLREELELAAGAFRLVEEFLELIEMAGEPDDLLGDVAALGVDGDLLDQVAAIELHVVLLQQRADALEKPVAEDLSNLRHALANLIQMASNGITVAKQLRSHGAAFLAAHALQPIQRLVQYALHR